MSWERSEMSWAGVRRGGKSWEEVARGEKSWEEVGRGESLWEELGRGEKSWAEVGRDEKNFESCWKELWELRRAEMVWEELKRGGHNWKGVKRKEEEITEQSWEAVRARCISPRHTEAFSHSKLLHREALHRASFYTEQTFSQSKLLHREAFTHRSFCTQQALTHSKLLHRDFFHTASSYTEKLYTEQAFTQSKTIAQRQERREKVTWKPQLLCCQSTVRNPHAATTILFTILSCKKNIVSIPHAAAAARNLAAAIPLRSANAEV